MSNHNDNEAQAFADGVMVGELLGGAGLEAFVDSVPSGQSYSVKRRGTTIAGDLDEYQLEAFVRGYIAAQEHGR